MMSAAMIAWAASQRQEAELGQGFGVLLAVVSSCLGGTAAAVTHYLALAPGDLLARIKPLWVKRAAPF